MPDPETTLVGGDNPMSRRVAPPTPVVVNQDAPVAPPADPKDRLDYAPDGGRFLRADGVLVDSDGVPVNKRNRTE